MTSTKGPELRPFDIKWLDRRGNFYALITPDQAAELLTRNTKNRSIKQQKIDQYARDIAAGKWNADASDIKFSSEGVLLDGQNRLLACVQADAPFPTLVRTGLDPAAQTHMDTGAVRSMADTFKMLAASDPFNVAAAISLRARYESILASGGVIMERRLPLTRQEAVDYLTAHPQVEKLTTLAASMNRTAPSIQRSIWLAGISMAAESSEDDAREFAGKFLSGVTGGPGDPLIALMRYAMSLQTPAQQSRGVKLKNAGVRHLLAFVTAWNAYRSGEPLERIQIRENAKVLPLI